MAAPRQPKKCPLLRFPTKTQNPISKSQGASKSPADASLIGEASDDNSRKFLSKVFHWSRQTQSGRPTPETADTSTGEQVQVAQQALDEMKTVQPALQTTAGLIGQASTAMTGIQTIEAMLQSLKLFNSFVTSLSNVHPYVQFALGILTGASQLLINQVNLDNEVFGLLDTIKDVYDFFMEKDIIANIDSMKETLQKMAPVVKDAVEFIIKYTKNKNFVVRIADSIVHDPQTIAYAHVKNLGNLMQQYRDRAIRDIQVNMYHVLEDLNLDGMAYAADAGLNMTKKCLDGTRLEILKEITDWITDCGDNAARIFWLHGQAGRGKSAIAHTIALWTQELGVLGSCFCFARDKQAERREGKILTTIARDLADRDPAFRKALSNIVSNNNSLKTTSDVLQQWKRFILDPLSEINGEIAGNVVVVIDALDESGPPSSREHLLRLLISPGAVQLPFRILLTSRALPDIVRYLGTASHVKATSLDDVPLELVERDIRLYITQELDHVPGIGETEIENIVKKSDGLFEWARLACHFIKPDQAGATPKERYTELMALESEEGRTLLDTTYFTILKGGIPQSGNRLERYRSVMRQVVMTLEPLPMGALNDMRQKYRSEQDHYDPILILEFMSPVLGGIMDRHSPVRPLHASFYDFLTNGSRSGVYYIDTSDGKDLAWATLQILWDKLRFNICGLESSYLANAEVPDLLERIKGNISPHLSYSCRFWSQHVEKTTFDPSLAGMVRDIVGSEKVLFWLEAMSLLGMVGQGVDALASVAAWLQGQNDFKDTSALLEDGIKFIQNFGSVMWHSTPHIYVSALPFIPPNTFLSAMLLPKFLYLPKVAVGGLKDWPAVQLSLQGHGDYNYITSVAFSPDGRKIVSGSDDCTVRVWDVERGVQIGSPLEGHTGSVNSVAFFPDGKRLVSGSNDNTVRVWDVENGLQISSPLVGHMDSVNSVAFSIDGNRIVSGADDNSVRIWDVGKGVQIGSPLEGHTKSVNSVAISPDGMIVSGSGDSTARVWDVDRGMQIGTPLVGHTGEVNSVAFSPDGKKIVSGADDDTVRIWDVEGGVQIGSPLMGHTNEVNSVAFSPEGKRVISGADDGTVKVWDVERGVQIGSPLVGHTAHVRSVAFSPDGKRIVSGSQDNTLRVWDVEIGVHTVNSLQGHTDCVNSVAFCHDGQWIVSGGDDGTVRFWDVERGVQIGGPLVAHSGKINSVASSPDGKRIVSGSEDNTVRFWDIGKGVLIGSPLEGHAGQVNSVAFSPDGKMIVSGANDNTVRVWDVGRCVQIGSPLVDHTDVVNSVAFSPDGKRMVSGSDDKTVRVWDVERGMQIGTPLVGHISMVFSAAFSPDGKRIVSGSVDRTVRVWDVERGVQIDSPLEGHTDWVTSVAFSPDGKKVVSGSGDMTVRVWDVERGMQIGTPLVGHTGYINAVAFSPDGKRIVSGADDATVGVWDVERGVQIGSPLGGHTPPFRSVAFSPDGKKIVSGSHDKTVRVWDVERGMQIGTPLVGHTGIVVSAAFSPDGKRIVSGSGDRTVRVWDVERGVQIGSPLEGNTNWVISVAFSPDGTRIVGGDDATVRVWDVERGVQIGSPLVGHIGYVRSVSFSPDGKRIVSGSWDKTVRVWDHVGRGVQIGSPFVGHTSSVNSVAFSMDGKMIVSGADDSTVRVWDVGKGVQIGSPLVGHTDNVNSVAFSPDGKGVVSCSSDNTVRVWHIEKGMQIGSFFMGHNSLVISVAFSHDRKRIASGLGDCTLRIWDVERFGQIGSCLVGHTSSVNSVAHSHDGMRIASGAADVIQRYHVCFSSVPSHAMHNSKHFLAGLMQEDVTEPVKLQDDGWIRGPKGRLLLWIPLTLRKPFYSMWDLAVLPRGSCVELDLSQMAHGEEWYKCLQPTSI